jgi:hypothetical protein
LQLAAECCRRNFRGVASQGLPQGIDWDRFLQLVRFHRIEGLAHLALRQEEAVPTRIATPLAAAATSIAAQNLMAATACHSLLRAFEAASVPVLFVKGLTLAALAYGNPAVKSSIDIDLLTDPADLARAATCLRTAGFQLVAPRHSLDRWHRSWKESVWRTANGFQLDLHTRLADNPQLIPSIGVHSPKQWVDVGAGISLPTLADEELLTYLAVHGAAAGWFRLKWISDFAAMLSARSPSEIDRFYERSQVLGGSRAAGQALLVSDVLFESLAASPHLSERLKNDPATLGLSRVALRLIGRAPAEPTDRFLGTLPIHLSQLTIGPGAAYKFAQVRQHAVQFLTRVFL